MSFKSRVEKLIEQNYFDDYKRLNVKSKYEAVSVAIMQELNPQWREDKLRKNNEKTAFYFSAEFLVGRLIYSNLLNSGKLDEAEKALAEMGGSIADFEEIEDCALGNGGLGRLAACFLDSAATHRLNVDGYGIRYKYGLFKQKFENGFQTEYADDWTDCGDPFSVRCEEEKVRISFKSGDVWAVPYDMPVIGYGGKKINTLRLWQSEPVNNFDFVKFNNNDYLGSIKEAEKAARISAVLYPNDNELAGKKLRLEQQYFFSAASIEDILRKFNKVHERDYGKLSGFASIQLNDTHPVIAIPELIRKLMEQDVGFDAAFKIANEVFSYTNHTVMEEALEKWDVSIIKAVIPNIYSVIELINKKLMKELAEKKSATERFLIKDNNRIHMARLAVYSSHAVNGVAQIHTDILKTDTLKNWYGLYPERFFNMTNGITQRRWLKLCNKRLAGFITDKIGDKWITDLTELKKLEPLAGDEKAMAQFKQIKYDNKKDLSAFIKQKEGIEIDPSFIFDIQIKRLHEYKRQLLNAFSILYIYNGLKDGSIKDFEPTVYIFGAKAAPGYKRAKGIIKFINCIAELVNADNDTNNKLKVVFVQNYNVSYAEKLVCAGDISEQISTAGKEASGTGNMKLMLNGAVTLGTLDGANIEIVECAGERNNYIFGATVDEIEKMKNIYNPKEIYSRSPKLKRVVDSLIDGTFNDNKTGMFKELYDSLLKGASWHNADEYFILYDFDSYIGAKLRANADYKKPDFIKKCFYNTVNAGKFSSDRTIKQYAGTIWKL